MSLEPDPLTSDSPPRSSRSPAFAAFLSFVIPGLGQAWAGQALRGALIALPVVALAGLVVAAGAGAPGLVDLVGIALQPQVLVAILVLDVILLGYRSWAIVDGYLVARRRSRPRAGGALGRVLVVTLVAVTVASHGFVAYLGWNTFDLVSGVFGSNADGNGPAWGDDVEPSPPLVAEATPAATPDALPASWPSPAITASPADAVDPDASASPSTPPSPATSSPTPAARADVPYWAKDGRLNILLLGGDAGPGRDSIRTDSMILLTVDLKTARAALASIPRNLLNVPLPAPYASKLKGGVFPDLLNALWRYANDRPGTFPGNNATRGFRAISATIGYITGTEIDGLAYVDLNGFVRLIDALGGLKIDVPKAVYDAKYPNENGVGTRVLDIKPGLQRMDGSTALAYARTRHQDSDYGRISRQQLVLLALRKQVNPCSLLPRLPDLVAIAKKSMYTNIPAAELPKLMALAARVDRSRIERIEFTPAKGYPEWVTEESVTRMRRAIRDAFKGDPPPPGGAPDLSLLSC